MSAPASEQYFVVLLKASFHLASLASSRHRGATNRSIPACSMCTQHLSQDKKGQVYSVHPSRGSRENRTAFISECTIRLYFSSLLLYISGVSGMPIGNPLKPTETTVLLGLTITAPVCVLGSLLQEATSLAISRKRRSHLFWLKLMVLDITLVSSSQSDR